MARPAKNGEARTFRIKRDLCDKIDKYANITMLSKTAIVEKALIEYFEKHKTDLQDND